MKMKDWKKIQVSKIGKDLILVGIFFVAALFIETATFLLLGFNSLPKYLLLDIAILLIVSGVVLLLPSFLAKQIVFTLFIVIQLVLSYINVTLYSIFGTVLTVDMINLIQEAKRAMESSVINRSILAFFSIMGLLFIAINILVNIKLSAPPKQKKPDKVKFVLFVVIGFVTSQFLGLYAFNKQVEGIVEVSATNNSIIGNDEMLFDTLLFEAESLKKFGTYGFYFQDINTTLFNLDKDKNERIEKAEKYIDEGEIAPTGSYTGVSAGNNVIVVMVETLDWIGISEELTPTLYGMTNENVVMTNYYSKSKTNISEAFGILGSYPLTQSFTSVLPGVAKLTDNNFNYSLPNLLKQEGYVGHNYLINHEKTFYKRNESHYNYGFNALYDISDFASEIPNSTIKEWGDWPLDSDFFKAAIDEIAPQDTQAPFFNWVTTMSMHGPYYGNYRLQPYYDKMEEINWQNPYEGTVIEDYYKHYTAAVMDVDAAIAYLFEELENRGLLDTTTVVIYGDHEVYYHDMKVTALGLGTEDYQNADIYRVPFFVYDNNLPAMQIDDFSCPYDIMPTIMDLLGISYNKNMYMGNSVLNEYEQTKVLWSLTGGVFNEDLFTINGVDIYDNSGVATASEKEEFLQDINEIVNKILIVNDLYNYDLFNS